jgi:hypothetical protein
MKNKSLLTKILAIAGTVLVWFPILAPLFFALERLVRAHRFMLDYLMPAELFPAVLVGGALLLWAALRMRTHRRLTAWALGAAVLLLVASQGLAVLTGLANGETEATGWRWALVFGFIMAYNLAVIVLGVGGIMLLRQLFKAAE